MYIDGLNGIDGGIVARLHGGGILFRLRFLDNQTLEFIRQCKFKSSSMSSRVSSDNCSSYNLQIQYIAINFCLA